MDITTFIDEPTPLWVGIVETLREFPRTIETVQFGLDQYYGWRVATEIISAELLKLAREGFVSMTDSHADSLCGYKLTQHGLWLQSGDRQLCPYGDCKAELVMDDVSGWHACGACERTILKRDSDSDTETHHLWSGGDALKIFGSDLPKMPNEIPTLLPVPIREGEFANG